MKVVFVTDQEYIPDIVGGRAYTIHELSKWLTNNGHNVTVLCRELVPRGRIAKNLIAGPLRGVYAGFQPDRVSWSSPYNVVRSRDVMSAMQTPAIINNADAIVLQVDDTTAWVPALNDFKGLIVVHLLDVTYGYEIHYIKNAKNILFIAISNFVSETYSKYIGQTIPVVYPIIEKSRYKSDKRGENVLFVNPVPPKGMEVAFQVVELCPEIPFLFIECWPQKSKKLRLLKKRVEKFANITWVNQTTDMKAVYARSKVLLAPSQWEEGFGRVVVEAQASGIPAVASDIGGLPEAVAGAGFLIPPYASPEVWAGAIRDLFSDTALYERYSRAATRAASREALSADVLGSQFVSLLKNSSV